MLVDGTWLEVVGRPSFASVAKIHQLLNCSSKFFHVL